MLSLKYGSFPVQNTKNIKYNICLLYANNKVNFFYVSWHGTMFSSFVDGILKLKSRVISDLNLFSSSSVT